MNAEEMEKLTFICTCAIDSLRAGGSVLIPIMRLGIVLQLLELMPALLESTELQVPIYIISSVAEEILAYANIIPEWLCRHRQEKLFSGEPLFAHATLIKEARIQVFQAIHYPELLERWKEPCIVFSPHWSMRLGAAVHLLRRWSSDQNSLLVLEKGVDAELALLPFKPMAMKVLQCSFLSGIRLQNLEPLLKLLKPKSLLFHEDSRGQIKFSEADRVYYYSENETLHVPCLQDNIEVEIATGLASNFSWTVSKGENITRLKGELLVEHGKHRLFPGFQTLDSGQNRPLLHWGSPNLEKLLVELSKMGIIGSLKEDESQKAAGMIQVHAPKKALVEVKETGTLIIASDANLASKIFEAIDAALNGI